MVVTEILLALSLENQDGSHGTSPHRYSTESSLLGFPHLGQDMVCDRYIGNHDIAAMKSVICGLRSLDVDYVSILNKLHRIKHF